MYNFILPGGMILHIAAMSRYFLNYRQTSADSGVDMTQEADSLFANNKTFIL